MCSRASETVFIVPYCEQAEESQAKMLKQRKLGSKHWLENLYRYAYVIIGPRPNKHSTLRAPSVMAFSVPPEAELAAALGPLVAALRIQHFGPRQHIPVEHFTAPYFV